MSEKDNWLLSDEKIAKKKDEIENINRQIEGLRWELSGGLEIEDNDYYEDLYSNSPESHLDDLFKEKEKLEEELFKDEYYKNIEKVIKNSEYETYRIGNLLTDEFTDADMFNRKIKAIQVAENICDASPKCVFNIGILGEWGIGKSTFLNMIKKEICKQKNVVEVSYDASSYSEQNQIWANFAKILFEKYEQEVMFPNLKYTIAKIRKSPRKYVSIVLVNIVIWIAIFLFAWGSKLSFSTSSLISEFSGFGFSLVGVLLLLSKIVFPWGKKLLETSIPLSQKVANTFRLPSYVEVLGTREQVRAELDVLFRAWLPKDNQKVTIFVDELDRCSDKGIVEFFQSIQLFFGNKKMMFIFAIEPSHLKKALAKSFEIGEQSIEEYTNNYMEKYISLVVPINNRVDYAEYTVKLIREINVENCLKISEKEVAQVKECIKCIPINFITPRKIKKIVNLLILIKSFCVHYYSDLRIEYCELFSWIIMKCFYGDATAYIASLFTKEQEYSPLKVILRNLSYNKNVKDRMQNLKYYNIVIEFKMHDIVIYNKLANDFSILI